MQMFICNTEVAGIFKKDFEDTKASYGFKIVDECNNTLFDLTDGLNIKVPNLLDTSSLICPLTDDNGILTTIINVIAIAVNSRNVVLMVQ
ncbi:hypothetical protein RhiirA5_367251 [Rhizophagus irregularis]|uniref:Uncharacterized protein n=2 Tax=Rhizophagus irregularis TaxID=588596 RepID=A0A2N0NTM2_9GLOM|nr:hypothetical protein RhiirA5_367251 [Rhizophagus irregularis]UZO05998.1 hypothetical protein OCT59_026334 [Rhizophagus irregularis]GBC16980.1 hypothetical protein GLOIN_2v1505199 [Rhizophagus irregularis DAOM 181602=DAOM 197198]